MPIARDCGDGRDVLGTEREGVVDSVCLINLPRGRESSPSVPLGLLCLRGALERAALPSLILDFELPYRRGELPHDGDELLREMARRAAETGAGIFGVTTDCSSYPAVLTFCRLLKEACPAAIIILGGAQASFVPRETLAAFPEVDAIVVGEAEESFPELVSSLQSGRGSGGVAGVVCRNGDVIVATPPRPPVMNLARLPRPDFAAYPVSDLKALFASPGPDPFLPVEAGRGCPKACTFCSTSRLWGRHRTKPPATVVEEMTLLGGNHGIGTFELIHDNIASDEGFLPEFCDLLARMGSPFSWSCSISTDLLDTGLAREMAKAGCMGVFVGIESASPGTQESIGKRLDLGRAEAMVHECLGLGIGVAVGFVIGFPGETLEDLGLTLLMAARLRGAGAEIRLSQLSLLPGTPLYRRHLAEAVLGEHYSFTSGPLLDFTGQRQMIARHPEVFSSFYTVPTPLWAGIDIGWLILFFHSVLLYFPQPLTNVLTAAATVGDGPVDLFRAWDAWRSEHRPVAPLTTEFVFYSFNDFLDHYDAELRERRGTID